MNYKNTLIYDYAYDLFKGVCEMNNIKLFKGDKAKYELPKDDVYNYYCESTLDDIEFGIISSDNGNIYRHAEILNLAVKFLELMNLKDIKVVIADSNLREILESIEVDSEDTEDTKNYQIKSGNTVLANGHIDAKMHTLKISFNKICDLLKDSDTVPDKTPIDTYVIAEDEESLNDAFIIATSLKDIGFKTEMSYDAISEKETVNIETTYVIVVTSKLMKHYQVKVIDTKTKEDKIISINDLENELYMNF